MRAERLLNLTPSPTLELVATVARMRAEGKDVIDFGIGEPDFELPAHIKQAATTAISEGYHTYTPVSGLASLKAAIGGYYKKHFNLDYAPESIIATSGGKQAIFNAFMATLNPGDKVLIPAPYWVSYPDIVRFCGASPVFVNCPESLGFKISPDQLTANIDAQTKWLVLNSPSNPTGAIYSRGELRALGQALIRFPDLWILTDDIYHNLRFDSDGYYNIVTECPEIKDRTLIVSGASKSFAMTGWRLGYALGPAPLIKDMGMIQSQSTTHPNSIAQKAAEAALKGSQDFLKDVQIRYKTRCNRMYALLVDSGLFSLHRPPEGAFYMFLNCSNIMGRTSKGGQKITTDLDLARVLLEEASVAVVPGTAFGMSPYIRISFAISDAHIEKGCAQILETLSH